MIGGEDGVRLALCIVQSETWLLSEAAGLAWQKADSSRAAAGCRRPFGRRQPGGLAGHMAKGGSGCGKRRRLQCRDARRRMARASRGRVRLPSGPGRARQARAGDAVFPGGAEFPGRRAT